MKVMIAHNFYGDYATGGEAIVFNEEAELLKAHSIHVLKYERSNSEIQKRNLLGKMKALFQLH